jgi:threonine dehydratase
VGRPSMVRPSAEPNEPAEPRSASLPRLGRPEVLDAAARVYRFAIRTSLRREEYLSRRLDADVYVKLESEQPVGSFKIRGATHRLVGETASEVVASSSGNHGIAVAYVAARLGRPATIVLPEKPNPTKRAAIERLGARVLLRGDTSETRNAFARRYADERGALLVPPFDDPKIVAGQGTVGLEIQDQLRADVLFCPVGGGGLLSGVAVSYEPEAAPALYGVQPEGAASMRSSIEAGRPVSVDARSFADGITVSRPSDLTFSIVRERVREIFTVRDDEILEATRTLWTECDCRVEPASAATVAAALRHRSRWRPSGGPRPTVVLVLSGGNISDEVRRRIEGHDGPSRGSPRTRLALSRAGNRRDDDLREEPEAPGRLGRAGPFARTAAISTPRSPDESRAEVGWTPKRGRPARGGRVSSAGVSVRRGMLEHRARGRVHDVLERIARHRAR